MIHIVVTENYSKETLKDLLEYIKDTADRELTYSINRGYDNDVVVETYTHLDEEITLKLSGTDTFKDVLCIIVEEEYCKAFLNGHPALIRNYVERML